MIIYTYKKAFAANVVSILSTVVAAVMIPLGISGLFGDSKIGGIILIAIGAGIYFGGISLSQFIADKTHQSKIKSSASFALYYCQQHPAEIKAVYAINPNFQKAVHTDPEYARKLCYVDPQLYGDLCHMNQKFGEMYILDEKGKPVKRNK